MPQELTQILDYLISSTQKRASFCVRRSRSKKLLPLLPEVALSGFINSSKLLLTQNFHQNDILSLKELPIRRKKDISFGTTLPVCFFIKHHRDIVYSQKCFLMSRKCFLDIVTKLFLLLTAT